MNQPINEMRRRDVHDTDTIPYSLDGCSFFFPSIVVPISVSRHFSPQWVGLVVGCFLGFWGTGFHSGFFFFFCSVNKSKGPPFYLVVLLLLFFIVIVVIIIIFFFFLVILMFFFPLVPIIPTVFSFHFYSIHSLSNYNIFNMITDGWVDGCNK
ncbi:hypothetical protein VTN77DRAFT_7584 [Rasamsonia byssochlamydoides]|uniref:uncharacterized protein n=1 Tax=Rasamsonia byssochlamydoides TaxID=89139 RepID=UPI00374429B6